MNIVIMGITNRYAGNLNKFDINTQDANSIAVQGTRYSVNGELGTKQQGASVNAYKTDGSILGMSAMAKDGDGTVGVNYTTTLKDQEIDNVQLRNTDITSLRNDPNRMTVLNYAGQNAVLFNTENGGMDKYRQNRQFNTSANLSYGSGQLGAGAYTQITTANGDTYSGDGSTFGVGVRAILTDGAASGLTEATRYYNWGRVSSGNNYGTRFGARATYFGVELVADLSFTTREGKRFVLPIGGILSNLAYGNIVGAVQNLWQAFSPEKLPIPRNEIVLPDSEPRLRTHIPMFEEKTTRLNENGVKMLGDIVQNYRQNPNMTIELGQYWDDRNMLGRAIQHLWGKSAAQQLSGERAQVIKDELVKLGIPADRIKIGHTRVQQGETGLTVEDNYTNARYKTESNLSLNDGGRFDVRRSSPAGEAKFDALMNSPEFKALTNGKSDIEKEIVANIIFDKELNGENRANVMKEIQETFYDKGILLSKSLFNLDDKEATTNIRATNEFTQFAEQHKLSDKEREQLSIHILNRNDSNEHKGITETLNDYQERFISRGLSLENLGKTREQYFNALRENPVFKELINGKDREEVALLSDALFANFIATKEYKDFNQQIPQALTTVKEQLYDKGFSYAQSVYESTGDKNSYYRHRVSDAEKQIRESAAIRSMLESNEFAELVKGTNSSVGKERRELQDLIKDTMLKNPNAKAEDVFNQIKQDVYDKGMTINQFQYQRAQDKMLQELNGNQQNTSDKTAAPAPTASPEPKAAAAQQESLINVAALEQSKLQSQEQAVVQPTAIEQQNSGTMHQF